MNIESIADKTIYVVLKPETANTAGDMPSVVKPVEKTYFAGTFRDLMAEVLNKAPTKYFSGYTPEETISIDEITQWYNSALSDPNNNGFAIKAKTIDSQDVPVVLEDRIADYSDRIIIENEARGAAGDTTKYYMMNLQVAAIASGGNYK